MTIEAKALYDMAYEKVRLYHTYQQNVHAYASYVRFYNRLRSATPILFALGFAALSALMAFAISIKSPAEGIAPSVVCGAAKRPAGARPGFDDVRIIVKTRLTRPG